MTNDPFIMTNKTFMEGKKIDKTKNGIYGICIV